MILTVILATQLFSQQMNDNAMAAWINVNVANYYVLNEHYDDGFGYLVNNENCIPRYISFSSNTELKIFYKYEQAISDFKARYVNGKLTAFIGGRYTIPAGLKGDVLTITYNKHKLDFIRVSKKYSKDVFDDFVTSLVFKDHKAYTVNDSSYSGLITADNFYKALAKIFKCKIVESSELSSFTFENRNLTEVALYGGKGGGYLGKSFGVLIDTDSVTFIDRSTHEKVLTLIPSN